MEYQVPQFIEVEDKVFGPFSLKQFIYLAGGIGLCVIIFLSLPFFVAVILGIPVVVFTGALAFYKVNNKSFIDIVEAAFNFYTNGRLYLWKKQPKEAAPVAAPVQETREKLRLTEGRLKELAWSLDIKDQAAGEPAGESLPDSIDTYSAAGAGQIATVGRGTPGLMNR
jgi:energy-coupling factor transporter transmembrane protein EcfT